MYTVKSGERYNHFSEGQSFRELMGPCLGYPELTLGPINMLRQEKVKKVSFPRRFVTSFCIDESRLAGIGGKVSMRGGWAVF